MTEFTCQRIETPRLTMNVWTSGPDDGVPVLLVHGNLTTGAFWKYVAEALPTDVRVIAPDLRGYGRTDPEPIDATVGLGDSVADVHGLLEVLGLSGQCRVNAAGWSMGGGVLQQLLIEYPQDLASITFLAPVSPYGFGGTIDAQGTPVPEFAGTGGGGVSPAFVQRLAAKDTSAEEPTSSPRITLTTFYGPGANAENVDIDWLLDELLTTRVGEDFYPGNSVPATHWPSVAPGDKGITNTMSPKYFNTTGIVDVEPKPAITWMRGVLDQIVSDRSMFDFATLGAMGIIPGWPGADVMPSQPMEAQTRAVLAAYAAKGGTTKEVVLEGVGHGIPLTVPGRVAEEIMAILVR